MQARAKKRNKNRKSLGLKKLLKYSRQKLLASPEAVIQLSVLFFQRIRAVERQIWILRSERS